MVGRRECVVANGSEERLEIELRGGTGGRYDLASDGVRAEKGFVLRSEPRDLRVDRRLCRAEIDGYVRHPGVRRSVSSVERLEPVRKRSAVLNERRDGRLLSQNRRARRVGWCRLALRELRLQRGSRGAERLHQRRVLVQRRARRKERRIRADGGRADLRIELAEECR